MGLLCKIFGHKMVEVVLGFDYAVWPMRCIRCDHQIPGVTKIRPTLHQGHIPPKPIPQPAPLTLP
jgi:hypothetical protein